MQVNILQFSKRRYLKLSLVLLGICMTLYLSQTGVDQPPNGGTWQGYVLGSLGAFVIGLLAWQGVRKRSYHSTLGTLQGWTSMHVYLGFLLPVIVVLHTNGQVGFNVHTVAFCLMFVVILSGFYGMYLMLVMPRLSQQNLANEQVVDLRLALNALDESLITLASQGQQSLGELVNSAILLTETKQSFLNRLLARDTAKVQIDSQLADNKNQQTMINYLATQIPDSVKQKEVNILHQLLTGFSKRQILLHTLRKDTQYNIIKKLWLTIHIPFTVSLIVALIGHVVSVFFYW